MKRSLRNGEPAVQVILNSEQQRFIQEQIERGKYQNPEQVITEALNLFATISQEEKDILTLEEMYQKYPNEWILIAYHELDDDLNVISGIVLAHSPDYNRLYENSLPREGKSIAIEFTGKLDENIGVLL